MKITSRCAPRAVQRGFTLIELLVVVAIIAVLAAIAIPQFSKYMTQSYLAELDSDAKNIYTAAQAYLSDNSLETVDSLSKLTSGGYQASSRVVFLSANMTTNSGLVEIYSTALNDRQIDNNAVVFANARIETANKP